MGTLNFPNTFSAGTTAVASEVNANFDAAETWSTAISDDNFSSSAGQYTQYRKLLAVSCVAHSSAVAGTYAFAPLGLYADNTASAVTNPPLVPIDLVAADYAITGRTTKLRLRAQASVGALPPSITLTVGLYPVSAVASAGNTWGQDLGTVVSGSTVAFTTPSATTLTRSNSGDFTFPTDGQYVVGVVLSGTLAVNTTVLLSAQLERHYV